MNEQKNLSSYPCPVCAHTSTTPVYPIKGFSLVRCQSCSMVYVNPRIPNDDLYRIYSDKYFHHVEGGYEDYELTASLRIKTFHRWYEEIRPFLNITSGLALDIGCAAGYFLQVLVENGWQVEGIELEKEMHAIVTGKGYTVFDTPLEYFNAARKYDLITLFDVIEHLPNLQENIKKLTQIMSDNGSIALVTPDFASTQRKLFGRSWFQYKPREHIQYFTLQTLQKAVHAQGLHVVYHRKSGQYADTSFLYNRLNRYGFTVFANIFRALTNIFGLSNRSWYADTGSMLVILQKKE